LSHIGPKDVKDDLDPHKVGGCCQIMTKKIIKHGIKLHLFGHFHSERGVQKSGKTFFVNCSSIENGGRYIAEPVYVEFD